jgi:endo-1,4-beta-xylanase
VIANLAKSNGQLLRCHNTVWYSQLPSWVSNSNFNNATLISVMQNHITNEITHYKGQCYAWDVVNEAINDDGSGTLRTDVFQNVIGSAYIPIAFATAAKADPNAKLYYNDYNIESPGAKSTAAQNIVKMVKAYGAKIDGVGLQSHFIVSLIAGGPS